MLHFRLRSVFGSSLALNELLKLFGYADRSGIGSLNGTLNMGYCTAAFLHASCQLGGCLILGMLRSSSVVVVMMLYLKG